MYTELYLDLKDDDYKKDLAELLPHNLYLRTKTSNIIAPKPIKVLLKFGRNSYNSIIISHETLQILPNAYNILTLEWLLKHRFQNIRKDSS